jgi:hypothetical protein
MTIDARTAHWTKTIYDPYVNVLRALLKPWQPPLAARIPYRWRPSTNTYREPEESAPPGAQHAIDPEAGSLAGSLGGRSGRLVLPGVLTDSVAREAGSCFRKSKRRAGS